MCTSLHGGGEEGEDSKLDGEFIIIDSSAQFHVSMLHSSVVKSA